MSRKSAQESRFAAGMCMNCGIRKHKKECKWCSHCLLQKQLTYSDLRLEREEKGKCKRCGRKREAGRKFCRLCLNYQAELTRAYRARLKKIQTATGFLPTPPPSP